MLRSRHLFSVALGATLALTACDEGGDAAAVDVQYDSTSQRVNVLLSRELQSGETLHSRVRRGAVGTLDCGAESAAITRIDSNRVGSASSPTFQGPSMTPTDFDTPYDNSWLEGEPTAEMLAMIADGGLIIDVCWMADGGVVRQEEFDARRALDRRGLNGKFDGEEARIASVTAYAEACVAELGEIPFFPALEAEGDYGTWNCLDSTPIPTTVTDAAGNVTYPEASVSECDNPQYIYSSCEPSAAGPNGAVRPDINGPRVTSAVNDQGTHWVLLCRKSLDEPGQFNDVAMIGSNPFTGETCFFQNALYNRTDGAHVPHPGDRVDSTESPQQSASLWEGIHGGRGTGIQCADCHSTDAFIHTPWIDGALREDGTPVVPRMGDHPDWAIGYNNRPYHLVNQDGQGWTMPRRLISDEAAACTRCHNIGDGRWTNDWIDRLTGDDAAWVGLTTDSHNAFEHRFWMPPSLEGLDENTFWDSEVGQSLRFVQECGNNPSNPACVWEDIPTESTGEDGALPTVDLEGPELARAALAALGANVNDDGTRRCAECHAISRGGLRRWAEYTDHAWNTCGVSDGTRDPEQAVIDLVNMADESTLDNEVGLRSDTAAAIVAGRPYANLAALEAVSGVGPATLADLSQFALDAPQHISQEAAMRIINCLRVVPEDDKSVFAAEHLGIMTTGVQYNYFRELFRAGYGSETNEWLTEYNRFRTRVSMPKGAHPAMTQLEYATLLKWFRNDLNDLDTVLVEPPPPATCTESFDATALSAHIGNMQFEGWGAVNADNNMRMFGCTPGADPSTCFTAGEFPDRSAGWGNGVGITRELHELGFRSSFWMRSSPDGNYVGNGGGSDGRRSTITDLTGGRDIGIAAAYDPGFFPDNSGFIFQGASGGAGICSLSVLSENDVDFKEPQCITARGINLYQHVARGLSGDYFIINSQFTSDAGRSATTNPTANFNASSTMKFTPMVFDGSTYDPQDPIIVDSPFEGDSVLSPSGQLVTSRLTGPEGRSLGFVVRRVNTNRFGDQYTITLGDPMATVCFEGAKAGFSYDERFMVTHSHVGDRTNIFMWDLMTGMEYQLTDMPENTRALFPHFRSDGWLYYLVMDNGSSREYVAASDAAIQIASGS